MAYITHFEIEGLAGRTDKVAHKLHRDVNIFFGPNGCGKTSLLKILHSAMKNDSEPIRNTPLSSASVHAFIEQHDRVVTRRISKKPTEDQLNLDQIEFDLGDHPESGPRGYSRFRRAEARAQWTTTPAALKEQSWHHRYLPIWRSYVDSRRMYAPRPNMEGLLDDEKLDLYFAELIDQLWTIYNNDVLIEVRRAQTEGLVRILQSVLFDDEQSDEFKQLAPKVAYERVKSFLHRSHSKKQVPNSISFFNRYNEDERLRRVVSDINEVEERIGRATAPTSKFSELISQMFRGGKHLRFESRKILVELGSAGKTLGLHSLSSGEKQVLRIFVEALMAGASSIIIDEPELSLHIDWQRELIKSIQTLNPRAQIIMATHSPEIMAEIPDNRILEI